MEELRAILMAHARRYPLMEPRDAVKLIDRNAFVNDLNGSDS